MSFKLGKKPGRAATVFLIMACFGFSMAAASRPAEGREMRRDRAGCEHRMDSFQEARNFKGKHYRPKLGIWKNQRLTNKLKLSEKQVKQLREADFSHREKILERKSRLKSLRLKMDKKLHEDNLDDKAILKLAEKIADIKGKLYIHDMEARLLLRKLLSEDQMKGLKAHVRSSKERFKRHGKGPFRDRRPHCARN